MDQPPTHKPLRQKAVEAKIDDLECGAVYMISYTNQKTIEKSLVKGGAVRYKQDWD